MFNPNLAIYFVKERFARLLEAHNRCKSQIYTEKRIKYLVTLLLKILFSSNTILVLWVILKSPNAQKSKYSKPYHFFIILIVKITFIDRTPEHIFTSCCKAFTQRCARQCVSITFASCTCTSCCASTCCEFNYCYWSLERRLSLYMYLPPVLFNRWTVRTCCG